MVLGCGRSPDAPGADATSRAKTVDEETKAGVDTRRGDDGSDEEEGKTAVVVADDGACCVHANDGGDHKRAVGDGRKGGFGGHPAAESPCRQRRRRGGRRRWGRRRRRRAGGVGRGGGAVVSATPSTVGRSVLLPAPAVTVEPLAPPPGREPIGVGAGAAAAKGREPSVALRAARAEGPTTSGRAASLERIPRTAGRLASPFLPVARGEWRLPPPSADCNGGGRRSAPAVAVVGSGAEVATAEMGADATAAVVPVCSAAEAGPAGRAEPGTGAHGTATTAPDGKTAESGGGGVAIGVPAKGGGSATTDLAAADPVSNGPPASPLPSAAKAEPCSPPPSGDSPSGGGSTCAPRLCGKAPPRLLSLVDAST